MKSVSKAWTSLTEYMEHSELHQNGQIRFSPVKCKGVFQCVEVCPMGCWTPDRERRIAVFHNPERCVACGACVLQCPEKAIALE
jgi:NAD-dependent dihydropyrimidine dehydrogenase PreA subunit